MGSAACSVPQASFFIVVVCPTSTTPGYTGTLMTSCACGRPGAAAQAASSAKLQSRHLKVRSSTHWFRMSDLRKVMRNSRAASAPPRKRCIHVASFALLNARRFCAVPSGARSQCKGCSSDPTLPRRSSFPTESRMCVSGLIRIPSTMPTLLRTTFSAS